METSTAFVEINKGEENKNPDIKHIEDVLANINAYFAYSGCFIELLIFVFLICNSKNKSSNICSSYFRLLAVGYFIDLLCFTARQLQNIPLNIDFPLFVFLNNICQWYGSLFIGPWNVTLSLNRLTAIMWYKKHKIWWSKRNVQMILIVLFFYPFLVNGYSFFNIQCKIALYSNECITFMKQGYYVVSISNGTSALSSLGIGISTAFSYHTKIKINSNLTLLQQKIERNLLLQSLFSSTCFLVFCLSVASYPYYFALRDDPDHSMYFAINAFLMPFLFNVFHYSSFILLLIYSQALRQQMIEFYCSCQWLKLIMLKSSKISFVKYPNTTFVNENNLK